MRYAIAPALILAACATAPQSAFPPIAQMHSPTLCYVMVMGNPTEQHIARDTLNGRGYACTADDLKAGAAQYQAMLETDRQMAAQRRAQGSAMIGAGLGILASQPQYQAPLVCRTYGNTTICN